MEIVMKYEYGRVRDLREDHDKTQAEIAKMLNTYTTQYRRWETGETEIPTHIIKKLCIYYNVSADYMIGLTNTPRPLKEDPATK
ncbi:MAG: helix-turn-helix transcriptional regulator [Clostridia bacterium]|nr:helix-turn-helix transcriptional regulator [Clostridia bacterium]